MWACEHYTHWLLRVSLHLKLPFRGNESTIVHKLNMCLNKNQSETSSNVVHFMV